jgi:aspartate/methionine/tyrosine aminotransferase
MKAVVLSDNRGSSVLPETEHGLSVYLDGGTYKVLLDTGASDLCIRNAASLGIGLEDVDSIFISHGHGDHMGGLASLLKINTKAKVIISPQALSQRFFSNRKSLREIGIQLLADQYPARFVKAFIDVDVPAECCVPVTGSMQGSFTSFITCSQCNRSKDRLLFIDPGFPVQKQQLVVLNTAYDSFDVYHYRGAALREKLESILSLGKTSALIYSNPNNPAWFCLKDSELKIIGELAEKYDVIVIEDLAYFAMDFRQDLGRPFEPPFQPSVAKYTDNYILLISASKAFSYAGQRIGVAVLSEKLYKRPYADLKKQYGVCEFGNVFVNRVLYSLSSGTSHSAQYAMAAMMKAASDGEYRFLDEVREYGRRAEKVKKLLLGNQFEIVYDNDLGEALADGFYFTVRYPGMSGAELMKELLFYGISAISLETTGSDQQGLRICTSFIKDDQYEELESRLKKFRADHPLN